jgi:hypothetical protein
LCRLGTLPLLVECRCLLLLGAGKPLLRQLPGCDTGLAAFTFVLALP